MQEAKEGIEARKGCIVYVVYIYCIYSISGSISGGVKLTQKRIQLDQMARLVYTVKLVPEGTGLTKRERR
jgi:hypothetical protein